MKQQHVKEMMVYVDYLMDKWNNKTYYEFLFQNVYYVTIANKVHIDALIYNAKASLILLEDQTEYVYQV